MHRTTILLPDDLRRKAVREARSLGISLSELIRQRIAPTPQEEAAAKPAFFTRKPWVDSGPADLAHNHDRYLYGP